MVGRGRRHGRRQALHQVRAEDGRFHEPGHDPRIANGIGMVMGYPHRRLHVDWKVLLARIARDQGGQFCGRPGLVVLSATGLTGMIDGQGHRAGNLPAVVKGALDGFEECVPRKLPCVGQHPVGEGLPVLDGKAGGNGSCGVEGAPVTGLEILEGPTGGVVDVPVELTAPSEMVPEGAFIAPDRESLVRGVSGGERAEHDQRALSVMGKVSGPFRGVGKVSRGPLVVAGIGIEKLRPTARLNDGAHPVDVIEPMKAQACRVGSECAQNGALSLFSQCDHPTAVWEMKKDTFGMKESPASRAAISPGARRLSEPVFLIGGLLLTFAVLAVIGGWFGHPIGVPIAAGFVILLTLAIILGRSVHRLRAELVEKTAQVIREAARVGDSVDAVVAKDVEGVIISWNPGAEAIFGYSAEEMVGTSIRRIIPPERQAEEDDIVTRILQGEFVRHYETVRQRKDGRQIHVSVSISPVRDAGGRIVGATKVARDISERHQEAEELRASFKEIADLKAALDEHAIVAITDPQGRITFANDKFCAISKYSRDELLGQDHRLINSGHHPKEFMRDLWATIGRGEVWHGEIRNRAKDGSLYWVDTTIVPFLNAAGHPRQYVAIRADITRLKEAENAIREQAEELRRSNQDLEQFAYVASHDLQEPLRAVAGCLQILQRRYAGSLDARADELIGHAVDGAQRMQTLIEGLLAFSRVRTRGREFEPVDCKAALEVALKNLDTAIRESGARIAHDPLPVVRADPVQLTVLFQNLIGNAIKFRREGPPEIHIGAERRDGSSVMFVRDNGIGIEPEYFERIFVIFQRLHTRNEYPGTGIGLSICKKIVERHGGQIWVESTAGRGSAFFCRFPE